MLCALEDALQYVRWHNISPGLHIQIAPAKSPSHSHSCHKRIFQRKLVLPRERRSGSVMTTRINVEKEHFPRLPVIPASPTGLSHVRLPAVVSRRFQVRRRKPSPGRSVTRTCRSAGVITGPALPASPHSGLRRTTHAATAQGPVGGPRPPRRR